jgi:signal transduction histidine kinase
MDQSRTMGRAASDSPGGELEQIFPGDSEMARRMRAFDWSQNPLGPPQGWPQNLKTCVRITLTSRHPMFVWWGERLIHLYNDGYAAFLHAKHPRALGLPAPVVWEEVWPVVGPRVEFAMHRSEGTYDEALMLILLRKGFPEEMYVTFSYSPVTDDEGGFGGILCPATEETERIIGERQMALLRELGARTADARAHDEACRLAASALQTNLADLPFALIYLIDPEKRSASLIEATGISSGARAAPDAVALDAPFLWPLDEVSRTHRACLVPDLAAVADELPVAHGYRVTKALAMPITPAGDVGMPGVLVVGLNPLRALDDGYRRFLDLVAGGISAAITNAQAYQAERRRAEALAELDRAKTIFFSNVSHEFRTPLTLMLAPLEDELRENPMASARLEIAHRNALRLLKLVNTLLDFSRIEAGRIEASYEATDLARLTTDLASVFRSAIEKAGLALVVDCPPLDEPVYVDRDMWEKIVLNLLSNALKFTFEGAIDVMLRRGDGAVELTVRDTGIGIAGEELPRIFERFHRIKGARARTHEGTGIGLALVHELVKLHGGTVAAESTFGAGTRFRVRMPLGSKHLPSDRIGAARVLAPTSLGASPFVEEALRWVPALERRPDAVAADELAPTPAEARVLVADDNSDMRDYLVQLMGKRWEVEAVGDGLAALEAVRRRVPELVLADVMMPGLDGFELLARLRSDPATREIPVILLSARAGEESRVEGMEAGADDYLIKPFSARELLARVGTHLRLARARAEALAQRETLLREVHHRVKNNLEVIDSLLHLQADAFHDPRLRAALGETSTRVHAIAEIHRLLHGAGDLARVDMKAYAEALSSSLIAIFAVAPERVRFSVDAQPVRLDLRHAVPAGLILNELVSNALKHAFPGGRKGSISVGLAMEEGLVALAVRDDGIGLPEPLPPGTLGLRLVRVLAEQLGGTVVFESASGTTMRVRFPAQTGEAR